MQNLESLFRSITIGPIELQNRIVMPPMVTGFGGVDWGVTDRLIDYCVERARGGAGMIIVESNSIDPVGVGPSAHLGIFKDTVIAGLNTLAETVKAYGVKIGLQLGHTGRQAKWVGEGVSPVAPSPVMCRYVGRSLKAKPPRELSVEEIGDLVEKFSEGALGAKRAGFDLVEVHGAHGYLVNEFMAPYTNKRTDQYGGDLEGRMRFPLEILRAIRQKVGKDFPVSFRINGDDYIEGGLTLDETPAIARMLENEGASVIHVSGSIYESIFYNNPKMFQIQPMCIPRGCFVHLGEGIKKAVSIPVIVAGRINDPVLADEIIRDGKADLVSMGRALVADPELPIKAKEGRLEDIRKCIACNWCITRVFESLTLKCSVNAEVGREREYRIEKAPVPKRVVVVGGGPAGMEAARVASLRGHTVSLYEKGDRLGGQLLLSAKSPFKEEIENLTQYLASQLKKLDVEVILRKEVKAEMMDTLKADVLIVATGSTPLIPSIPGIDAGHVVMAHHVLRDGIGVLKGKEKMIVAGGGMVGCETAEFIWEESKGRKKIVIVEMLDEIASDVDPTEREFLIQRLKDKRVEAISNMKVEEIMDDGIIAMDREGKRHRIKGEFIVLAMGAKADRELAQLLDKKGMNFYAIGDCASPRRIFDAIHEAAHVARQI
ncbi:MAG: FAD-dependent oxidoreductase [Deltaproteobacteria bacterium]|nr:FAD-dependent oxidoreductase [Deltaproteobacteria bacterium]